MTISAINPLLQQISESATIDYLKSLRWDGTERLKTKLWTTINDPLSLNEYVLKKIVGDYLLWNFHWRTPLHSRTIYPQMNEMFYLYSAKPHIGKTQLIKKLCESNDEYVLIDKFDGVIEGNGDFDSAKFVEICGEYIMNRENESNLEALMLEEVMTKMYLDNSGNETFKRRWVYVGTGRSRKDFDQPWYGARFLQLELEDVNKKMFYDGASLTDWVMDNRRQLFAEQIHQFQNIGYFPDYPTFRVRNSMLMKM